jgi:hypothetical protein
VMMRRAIIQVALLLVGLSNVRGESEVYSKQIKPLLQERCYSCHGALKQKSGLRLDTVEAMRKGGSDGPAVVPGRPEKSLILQRVTATDVADRMPPEHEGQPLSSQQVAILRDWIASGAIAPANEKPEADPREHWAFRQITRPIVPTAVNGRWVNNPIDAFIGQGHEAHQLKPQLAASSEILLRRLYLDLIGVPPSADEIRAVKSGTDASWYEATARRLLDDPRYGERWGRHWMDIWRYTDPYGLGEDYRNSQKHIWHWRDWIVESLNRDVPYDEMVRLMLAADESHPTDVDKLRATGFLARNFYLFNRNQWLEETVEHVSKGFLGLTMNCAKCHDHKYDPIRQQEFYAMRAFFEPYQVRQDLLVSQPDVTKDGIPRAFDAMLDTPTYRFVRGQENQPDKSKAIAAAVPAFLMFDDQKIEKLSLPVDAYEPERRHGILEAHLEAARNRRSAAIQAVKKPRETLAAALRDEAKLLEAANIAETNAPAAKRQEAKTAVEEARAALNVAEASLAHARADVLFVKRRVETMQARWQSDATVDERRVSAVKAEREGGLAKAQLTIAEIEARLIKAAADKKESISKELKDARDAAEKAKQLAAADVKPEDTFTPLPGAKLSPTRFASSTADDPPVKFPRESSGRRTALAKWITDARNPLTARVAVNHIWAHHFGAPLVATTFDFGRKGAEPTHRELLDWLAAEFIESGWSMKHIHWLIVNSATYKMSSSSAGATANISNDPDNKYLWRRNPIRLEAEAIRDSMLAVSGDLDSTMGGPTIPADQQENSRRRSLYFFHSNNERNLFLTTFDGAGVRECYRREQSIVPQQALALNNSKLALESARGIASRLNCDNKSDETFIRAAMLTLLAIDPSTEELIACKKALADFGKTDATQARAHLIWALMNHNDFVTLR